MLNSRPYTTFDNISYVLKNTILAGYIRPKAPPWRTKTILNPQNNALGALGREIPSYGRKILPSRRDRPATAAIGCNYAAPFFRSESVAAFWIYLSNRRINYFSFPDDSNLATLSLRSEIVLCCS